MRSVKKFAILPEILEGNSGPQKKIFLLWVGAFKGYKPLLLVKAAVSMFLAGFDILPRFLHRHQPKP
jgi:hypothetical protein